MEQQNGLRATIGESLHASSEKVTDYLLKEKPTKMRLSRPVLGLPLRGYISQDVHSFLDYASGFTLVASAGVSGDRTARWAGATLVAD